MSIYIAEIAGKDSIAAVHMVIRENPNAIIIPSIVYTRTEYGGFDSYYNSVEFLKNFAKERNVIFKDIHNLSDEKLWNIMCIKYQYQIYSKFSFYTPCIMCHLFAHLLRVPLFYEYAAEAMITGERFLHNGIQKINQHPLTIDCFKRILEHAKVKIEQPLAMIMDTNIIDSEIANINIIRHANDTKCVLSGNLNDYYLKELELKKFLNKFVEPIGIYIVEMLQQNQLISYDDLELFIKGLF